MLLLYMRYSTSSFLNPYKVFFNLHTWVYFWYTSKPLDLSTKDSFSVFFIWEEQYFTCKFQSMDTTIGIFGLLEQVFFIAFSLLLEEPLVPNLEILPFISLSQFITYIVLHHNFHFLFLISLSGFKPWW
jgi:hypothetical protein